MRYRHLTWKQVRPLLIRVWGRATAGSRDRRLLDAANAVIDSLGQPWLAWRDVRLQTLGLTEPAVGGGVLREPTTTGGPRPSSGKPNADVESVAAPGRRRPSTARRHRGRRQPPGPLRSEPLDRRLARPAPRSDAASRTALGVAAEQPRSPADRVGPGHRV